MRLARTLFTLSASLSTMVAGAARAQDYHVAGYSIGGDGGTDYLTAEPGTGRVFVSRGTHVMVIDGATGTVLGDIPDTPRSHERTSRARAGDRGVLLRDYALSLQRYE